MTPTVALRRLYELLLSYRSLSLTGQRPSTFVHFTGTICPPRRHVTLPLGDPVFDAVADYASKVVARAGLLTSRPGNAPEFDQYAVTSRQLFTIEHALAVDFARTTPDVSIDDREAYARMTLALAAYWCDRCELTGLGGLGVHPLLGLRPTDSYGAALYDHAIAALEDDVWPAPITAAEHN